ncbi:carboxypeptidase-like regulatory domain-containing protein [Nocardioides sp. WS12]|uniref:carboxypeptidase-like regulatory domain-containing protein n=1 Tax=Nocardioides sp. WS12 TaxID=2486272 RepID=UPI0015F7B25C|nr:carboxypeptidase-like regulatory domain-containing protein [Nocardioides sp. WS12]
MKRLLGALLALTLFSLLALVAPARAAETTAAVITGTVTSSSDGAPIAGVRALLYSDSGQLRVVNADTDGHFQFVPSAPGGYRIRFESKNTITKWYDGDEVSGSVLTVGDSGTVDASTTLSPAGVVRGAYTGPDPTGVSIRVAGTWESLFPAFTVGGGEFTAKVTTERPIVVGLTRALSPLNVIARFNGNKYHWTHAPELQVAGGTELSDIAIDLQPTAIVTGQITNVSGAGISADVRMILIEDGERIDLGGYVRTWSDDLDGQFSMVVPATTLTLKAIGRVVTDGYETRWLGEATDVSSATVIAPTEGQTLSGNDINQPGGKTLSGVVLDPAGDPVPGVDVTAYGGHTDVVKGSAVSANDGTWSIPGLGLGSTMGITLRYTSDRTTTVWYPNQPTQISARDAVELFLPHPDELAIQAVTHLPEYRLAASSLPTIEGPPVAGLPVSARSASVTPTPDTSRYEWLCNGVPLGLTGEVVVLPATAAGCSLKVRQVASLAGHQSAIVTSLTTTVASPQSTNGAAVLGSRVAGSVLTLRAPIWNFTPDQVTYRWYRSGVPITGATGASYRLVPADVADFITVKVTAVDTRNGISASATSLRMTKIKARTRLEASWVGDRKYLNAVLKIRVLTPGLSRPGGGYYTIRYPNYAYRGVAIRELIRHSVTAKRRGWVTVRFNYAGSQLDTAASTSIRVYVR